MKDTPQKLIEKSKIRNSYIIISFFALAFIISISFNIYAEMFYSKTYARLTSWEYPRASTKGTWCTRRYWFEIKENDRLNYYKSIMALCNNYDELNQTFNILYSPGNTESVIVNDASRWTVEIMTMFMAILAGLPLIITRRNN
jgi:hypothetical protein